MPELPEVETTLRGIKPHIEHQLIKDIIIRHYQLRWPVPRDLQDKLKHKKIKKIERRAKYLLISVAEGTIILHLGMSGSLRILAQPLLPKKHDHIDIEFENKKILRFTDPRRFGAFLWTEEDPALHPLLKNLGPEPLDKSFSAQYLLKRAQGRKVPVKSFIMDNKIVVGVGNIYATEALFIAGINPKHPADKISLEQYKKLVKTIKAVLLYAIKQGGTTLKDFLNSDGKPGYFINKLKAYGRAGLSCVKCHTTLKSIYIGQRNTVYCEKCQK